MSAVKTRFLFTGREWLNDLRVYDYRNRMYQPELGRFLQPDPIQFKAGDYNLYRYCHNDPVNKSDPTGLEDVNYFDNGVLGIGRDPLRKWVTRAPDDKNTFTAGAHGSTNHIYDANRDQHLTATQFATREKNNPDLRNATSVRLYACSTGENPKGFAQQLANQLNKPVIAPNNTLWMRKDGTYFVAPPIDRSLPIDQWKPDMNKPGRMVTFYPRK